MRCRWPWCRDSHFGTFEGRDYCWYHFVMELKDMMRTLHDMGLLSTL